MVKTKIKLHFGILDSLRRLHFIKQMLVVKSRQETKLNLQVFFLR